MVLMIASFVSAFVAVSIMVLSGAPFWFTMIVVIGAGAFASVDDDEEAFDEFFEG